jgi:predicted Zn-dependent peptidase
MMSHKFKVRLAAGSLAAACILMLVLAPATFAFDIATIEQKVTKFSLPNGLRVIVMEDHSAPVVTCVTFANVGDADDPKGATGLAHVFEHMAFKGTSDIGTNNAKAEAKALEAVDVAFGKWRTETLKAHLADTALIRQYREEMLKAQEAAGAYVVTNEFGKLVEENGGVGLNAGTGYDQTVYFFSLPSNRVELWFALESSRFHDPVIREFYKEVDVVKEERRMRIESSPFGKLMEEFLGAAFKAHPYGISGIGHMSDLSMLTRDEAIKFFKTYYGPSNLVIAIVGDVNTEQVKKLAQTYFGRLQAVPTPPRLVTVEPPQQGERRVEVEDASQPILMIGYHRPAETHPDNAALSALSDYLGQGRTSLIYKRLVKQEKIAVQAGAFPQFPASKYPNLFVTYAVPSPGITAAQCEKAILEEVEKVKNEILTAEELNQIKARKKAELVNQLNSRQGMAIQLAGYETAYGDWRQLFKELDQINAVTAEDIQRVAKEYLTGTNRTVGYIRTQEAS